MKKWIVALIVLCLAVSVQGNEPNLVMPEDYVTLRLLTEPEFTDGVAHLEGWLGLGKKESESGIAIGYETWQEEDGTESKLSIGVFTMYHLPDARPFIEDIIWPAEWIPEGLTAKPAIGGSGLFDIDGRGIKLSPTLELTIYKTVALQLKRNIFTSNVDADDSWQIGLTWIWEF